MQHGCVFLIRIAAFKIRCASLLLGTNIKSPKDLDEETEKITCLSSITASTYPTSTKCLIKAVSLIKMSPVMFIAHSPSNITWKVVITPFIRHLLYIHKFIQRNLIRSQMIDKQQMHFSSVLVKMHVF